MSSSKPRTIVVDAATDVCYITLSERPVARTEEYSDSILVDLDEFGVAVGIEVLDLDAEFPLTHLCRELHIHSDDEPYLAKLLPTLRRSLRFSLSSTSDPTIQARTGQATMFSARA
ncbi:MULTISPECIES: DUF2283 domain-containing protein [Actinomyces]|uniref:DUF2283 domain-containing protein n=1 Tax=Actinomyces respiraculi TaxID=2744574 RepID=A0A7T0LJS0_9ACTO|nr:MULTISPECIES: DUF2283 domain-containing protein [Actinomyces]QPL05047.1 DUF2283 domain-containing protein [Actinomyces respiraculi]